MEGRGDWKVLLFISDLLSGRWRWKMSISRDGDELGPIIDREKGSLKID